MAAGLAIAWRPEGPLSAIWPVLPAPFRDAVLLARRAAEQHDRPSCGPALRLEREVDEKRCPFLSIRDCSR
jgi:hypothetical protein